VQVLDLACEHACHAFNRLPFPRANLRRVQLALGCDLLHRLVATQSPSATAALNLSEKFRLFVILVSIHSGWLHLNTLSNFGGPLQSSR
jgi:hypothetical protein